MNNVEALISGRKNIQIDVFVDPQVGFFNPEELGFEGSEVIQKPIMNHMHASMVGKSAVPDKLVHLNGTDEWFIPDVTVQVGTKDTHKNTEYLQSVEGRANGQNLPLHTVKGTPGWNYFSELDEIFEANKDCMPVFEKGTFPSLDFANTLKNWNSLGDIKVITFCGLVSHICVFTNMIMARSACPNATIIVYRNLTKSYDTEIEQKMYDLAEALGFVVMDYPEE